MRTTTKLATLLGSLALVLTIGCETGEKTDTPPATQSDVSTGVLCDCGEYKGTENCCNAHLYGCGKFIRTGSPFFALKYFAASPQRTAISRYRRLPIIASGAPDAASW